MTGWKHTWNRTYCWKQEVCMRTNGLAILCPFSTIFQCWCFWAVWWIDSPTSVSISRQPQPTPSLSQLHIEIHRGNVCMMHTLNTLATCLTATVERKNAIYEKKNTESLNGDAATQTHCLYQKQQLKYIRISILIHLLLHHKISLLFELCYYPLTLSLYHRWFMPCS